MKSKKFIETTYQIIKARYIKSENKNLKRNIEQS